MLRTPTSSRDSDPSFGEQGPRGPAEPRIPKRVDPMNDPWGSRLALFPEREAATSSPQEWMVSHSQGVGVPALGVRPCPRALLSKCVYHGCGDPREREEVSQVQRVQEMEGTRCRVTHEHAQEGDSRGGGNVPRVPGHDQQLLLAAEALPGPPGGGAGGGPEGARVQHAAGGGPARRQQHERPHHGGGTAPPRPRRAGSGGAGPERAALAVGGASRRAGHDWPRLGGSES